MCVMYVCVCVLFSVFVVAVSFLGLNRNFKWSSASEAGGRSVVSRPCGLLRLSVLLCNESHLMSRCC